MAAAANQTHDELSAQLAQMAAQLKRNAVHFAGLLDADRTVTAETEKVIVQNAETMTKERLRVRDLRGKTGGTTCIVLVTVVVVVVAWIWMLFVIRFTR